MRRHRKEQVAPLTTRLLHVFRTDRAFLDLHRLSSRHEDGGAQIPILSIAPAPIGAVMPGDSLRSADRHYGMASFPIGSGVPVVARWSQTTAYGPVGQTVARSIGRGA